MQEEVTKVIIPAAGMGTRFFPLSKALAKELWPLVDKPVIHYILEEARNAGLKEVFFVINPGKRGVMDYFRRSENLEKVLKERKKDALLEELKQANEPAKDLSISYVTQPSPAGDGHAILQAAKMAGSSPCAVLMADDIVESKVPAISQLLKIFRTCQKPVVALCRLPAEKLPSYGVIGGEKIANRLYKIKEIVEKPALDNLPSNLAIVGKYIITPEVFDYLKKAKPGPRGEILFAEVLDKMVKDGKLFYGYEIEGKWLECGNKLDWLKSSLYFAANHPKFGAEIRDYIKGL